MFFILLIIYIIANILKLLLNAIYIFLLVALYNYNIITNIII